MNHRQPFFATAAHYKDRSHMAMEWQTGPSLTCDLTVAKSEADPHIARLVHS